MTRHVSFMNRRVDHSADGARPRCTANGFVVAGLLDRLGPVQANNHAEYDVCTPAANSHLAQQAFDHLRWAEQRPPQASWPEKL
jgi:hypothetical protein